MVSETLLEFELASSDDAVWDQAGNLLVPGGRKTGAILRKILTSTGLTCSELVQRSFYGWQCYANVDRLHIFIVIQAARSGRESWLVILEQNQSLLTRWFAPHVKDQFDKVVESLCKELQEHPSVTNARRYTTAEYLAEGQRIWKEKRGSSG
jgi:hypothetical protein